MARMYKIEIRNPVYEDSEKEYGKIYKKKYYEDEKTYQKWFKKHSNYSVVLGFVQGDDFEWELINSKVCKMPGSKPAPKWVGSPQ